MSTATLKKWGSSIGVVIPKKICQEARIDIGDTLEFSINSFGEIVAVPYQNRKYHHSEKRITIDELFKDYDGSYKGAEPDWGKPVGSEIDW